jgi:hypothetical protein
MSKVVCARFEVKRRRGKEDRARKVREANKASDAEIILNTIEWFNSHFEPHALKWHFESHAL